MVAPTEPSEQTWQAAEAADEPRSTGAPSLNRLAAELRTAATEFGEYAKYLVLLQIDRAKHVGRKVAFLGALGVVVLVGLFGLLITGAALFVLGIAGLVGLIFNDFWLGAAIVGFLAMAAPPLAVFIAWKVMSARAIAALKVKYEGIRHEHKRSFGRDIGEVSRG